MAGKWARDHGVLECGVTCRNGTGPGLKARRATNL
jgi:hypothetical protein